MNQLLNSTINIISSMEYHIYPFLKKIKRHSPELVKCRYKLPILPSQVSSHMHYNQPNQIYTPHPHDM